MSLLHKHDENNNEEITKEQTTKIAAAIAEKTDMIPHLILQNEGSLNEFLNSQRLTKCRTKAAHFAEYTKEPH